MLTEKEFQEQIRIRDKLIDELQWELWYAKIAKVTIEIHH